MRVLISAGPTREAIDPVRYISNRSSGRMGYALAEAAIAVACDTLLVSGPVSLTPPAGLRVFENVVSAAQMAEAMKRLAPDCDIVVMCAAVADYRPVSFSSSKIKKSGASMTLELERTEDILASLGAMKAPGQLLAGFAAETDDLLKNAEAKLKRKNLDWIVANDVSRSDRGMDSESNAVTMLSRDGSKLELPLQAKRVIAAEIISKLLESARAKRS